MDMLFAERLQCLYCHGTKLKVAGERAELARRFPQRYPRGPEPLSICCTPGDTFHVENHPTEYTLGEWLAWRTLVFFHPRDRRTWLGYLAMAALWSLPGVLVGLGLALLFFALGGK
jgi:hypothetical protein